MNISPLRPGEQDDMSIVDLNGIVMSAEDREEIVRSSHALPVFQKREEILYLLREGNNLILDASTGSGKSTWGPIFAREALGKRVIQTVPRVLAAMTCAERISQILLAKTGNIDYTMGYREVGYRTGGGVSSNGTANLSIHTDGLEMMRQLYSGIVPEVIIIDEVQNKSIATELILFLTKYKVETQVIIMSATLDPELYRNYMKSRGDNMPIIKIPGKVFPIYEEYHNAFGCLDKTIELAKSGRSGLHIVSGKSRIEEVIAHLKNHLGHGYEIIPFHAELTKEEQKNVALKPENGLIRVAVATNVSEDSLTLAWLNFVVDEGMNKVARIKNDGISGLRVEPATLASTRQRRGRIGRIKKEGSLDEYHRFNDVPKEDLHAYPEAEIENSTLEREILLFKKAGMDIGGIVNRANLSGTEAFIHPVDPLLLHVGYTRLTQIGALDVFGNITELGEDILSISLEPSHARMILEGIRKGLGEEMIVIASILSIKGFLSKEETWRKIKNGENKKSDIFTYLDLYDLVTKKQINQDILANLVYLGLDRDEVQKFEEEGNSKAFYELVDLSPLGIKNHRIAQIANKVNQIQNSLIDRGIQVSKSKNISSKQIHLRAGEKKDNSIQDILTCIASGYPYYVFEYLPEEKCLRHRNPSGQETKTLFKQASTSSIQLSPNKLYVGVPFIIGADESMQRELESDETIFDIHNHHAQSDLCIVSHISEIGDGALKEAFIGHKDYTSLFPKKKKQENKGILNYEDLQMKYDSLIEEFSEGSFSRQDFMKYALPLLLMIKNHDFKKFLIGKGSEIINSFEQRLQKFFISKEGDYIDRITQNISDIESGFGGDTYIYDEFRDWEQKFTNARKKAGKGKHIPTTTVEEIQKGKTLFEARNRLNEKVGLLHGSVSDLGENEIKNIELKMLGRFIDDMLLNGGTYNTLFSTYCDEFGNMSEEEKKATIEVVHEIEDDGNYQRSIKTRLSQINGIKSNINKLISFCGSGKKDEYNSIDFDFCNSIFEQDKNKGILNKSQKSRYHKGIQAIHKFINDKKGTTRSQQGLENAQRAFQTALEKFNEEEVLLSQKLETKKRETTEKKISSFETRKELHFFFSKYYEEGYFNTVIQKKIPDILIEILSSGNFQGRIERWITEEFEISKLKKITRTLTIHEHLKKKGQYEKLLSSLQSEVSRYTRGNITEIDEINSLSERLEKGLKILSDLKSQILSSGINKKTSY